jgi:hypothetical protein
VNKTPVRFKDLHKYNNRTSYWIHNESLKIWQEFLKEIPPCRTAGICSAGEIGLFGLLTRTQRDLVLVDHSYSSLSIAMFKYLALREYGVTKTHRLFTTGSSEQLYEAFQSLSKHMPPQVRDCFPGSNMIPARLLHTEWKAIPTPTLRQAHTKLDRVRFIHGDLSDLSKMRPFGLLYLSNALEHTGRERKSPTIKLIQKAVKPGGFVIAAGHQVRALGEILKSQRGAYVAHKISWHYTLYQVPA